MKISKHFSKKYSISVVNEPSSDLNINEMHGKVGLSVVPQAEIDALT